MNHIRAWTRYAKSSRNSVLILYKIKKAAERERERVSSNTAWSVSTCVSLGVRRVIIVSFGKLYSMSIGCINNIISNSKYYYYTFWFSLFSSILAVVLNIYLITYLLICLLINLFTYLFIYLFTYLFTY